MINLNEIVNESLKKLESENFVENVVKQQLEKTIKGIVEDTFREYSDFGKSLKEYINRNLNVNFDDLGITGYNGLVLTAIKEQLDKCITVNGINKIKETMDDMLLDVKSEYNLSDIIKELKDESLKDEDYYEDDKIELIIEGEEDGYKHIYLSEEESSSYHSSKWDCDYQIDIDSKGIPYSIKLKGNDINSKKVLGGLFGLDRLLFKIYSAGSRIILDKGLDPEDYDIYYREDY